MHSAYDAVRKTVCKHGIPVIASTAPSDNDEVHTDKQQRQAWDVPSAAKVMHSANDAARGETALAWGIPLIANNTFLVNDVVHTNKQQAWHILSAEQALCNRKMMQCALRAVQKESSVHAQSFALIASTKPSDHNGKVHKNK